jgi:4-amino-4-deoxy-L-arabinose transferase-like glycosyltransferase
LQLNKGQGVFLKRWLPAGGIFCLALLVRVIYNVTVAYHYYPLHDSLFYQVIGFNLLTEHCFCLHSYIPTVGRAPLWSAIIAVIAFFLGPSDFYARLFLCFVGSGTCVLLYLFARDVFGRRLGVLAGIIAAIYPELYIYDGWLYTESLYIFLLLALCYGLYRLQRTSERSQWWLWIVCGLLLGLLSLTRPNGMIVLGLLFVWAIMLVWVKRMAWQATVKGVVIATLVALALIVPWTLRNYLVSHAFIPVATGDGIVLLGAYNDEVVTEPGYEVSWINPLKSSPEVAKPFPLFTCSASCEVAQDKSYRDHAEEWMEGHLSSMPYLLTFHFLNMWQPDTHESDLPTDRFPQQLSSLIVLVMMRTFPIPIFILAAFGLLATVKQWRDLLFVYFMIVLTIAECVVFYGSPRFRAPIEPMLILLAVGAIWWLLRYLHRPKPDHVSDGVSRMISSASSAGRCKGIS